MQRHSLNVNTKLTGKEAFREVLEVSLFNAELIELNLSGRVDSELTIRLVLSRRDFPSKSGRLVVEFTGINAFTFNYSNDYYFYKVETAKFFEDEEGYYLSLDPDPSTDIRSEQDQDVIIANHVSVIYPAQ